MLHINVSIQMVCQFKNEGLDDRPSLFEFPRQKIDPRHPGFITWSNEISSPNTVNKSTDLRVVHVAYNSNVAGCTTSSIQSPDTITHTHPFHRPKEGRDVPVKPLMSVDHSKDKMNGTNSKCIHVQKKSIYTYTHTHKRKAKNRPMPK